MSKFTPGPWIDKRNGKFLGLDGWEVNHEDLSCVSYLPVKAGEEVVAIVVFGSDDYEFDDATMEANARLIAAAPELLEALREIADVTTPGDGVPNIGWLHGRALAAIAKATQP